MSMRRMIGCVLWAVFAAGASLAAVPCHAGPLRVVTTTTDLAAVVRAVAGDRAEVVSLCSGTEDPHFLQAKPSFIMAARNADLWIRIGMDLEIGWEPPILAGSRNPRIAVGSRGHLDASEKILPLDVPATRVTRAMGDVHPQGNPHFWLDPLNVRIVAGEIAARLKEIRPEEADRFDAGLRGFEETLDRAMFGADLTRAVGGSRLWALALRGDLDAFLKARGLAERLGGWAALMAPHRGKKIVTHHRSWVYFARRFGLTVAGELEPKPGIPPSPSHLNAMVGLMEAQGIGAVVLEPYYSRKAADFVASRTGASVLVVPNSVGGAPGAVEYPALMDLIVTSIAGGL